MEIDGSAINSKLDGLESRIAKSVQNISKFKAYVAQQNKRDELLKTFESRQREMEVRLQLMTAESSSLRASLAAKREEIDRGENLRRGVEDRCSQLASENAVLQSKLKDRDEEVKSLKTDLEAMFEECTMLRESKGNTSVGSSPFLLPASSVSSQSTATAEDGSPQTGLKNDGLIDILERQIASLQTLISEKDTNVVALQKELESARSQHMLQSAYIATLSQDISELEKGRVELETVLKYHHSELSSLNSKIKELDTSLREKNEELRISKENLQRSTEMGEALVLEINAFRIRCAKLEDELAQIREHDDANNDSDNDNGNGGIEDSVVVHEYDDSNNSIIINNNSNNNHTTGNDNDLPSVDEVMHWSDADLCSFLMGSVRGFAEKHCQMVYKMELNGESWLLITKEELVQDGFPRGPSILMAKLAEQIRSKIRK